MIRFKILNSKMSVIDTYPNSVSSGKTNIPDKYKSKFMSLLEDLEAETGTLYTVEVKELNSNSYLRFKPFDHRGRYSVYDMLPKYNGLEGEYKTIDEIKKKIVELQAEELGVKDGVWECVDCHRKNSFFGGRTYGHCCKNGCHSRRTIWDEVEPFPDSSMIGEGDFELTTIGKLKVFN